MSEVLEFILIAVSAAGGFWMIYGLDWGSTKRFPYYGQKEKTKILQDKYGQAAPWKVAILIAVKMSPFLLWFFTPIGAWIALWGPLVGIPHLIMGLNNDKNARSNRRYQEKLVEQIRSNLHLDDESFATWLSTRVDLNRRHDRFFFEFFRWFYYQSPSVEAAQTESEQHKAKLDLSRQIRRWVEAGAIFPA